MKHADRCRAHARYNGDTEPTSDCLSCWQAFGRVQYERATLILRRWQELEHEGRVVSQEAAAVVTALKDLIGASV